MKTQVPGNWQQQASDVAINRNYRGGFDIAGDFTQRFIRAVAASTQDDILDLRLAANTLVSRLDRAIADEQRERERASAERQRAFELDEQIEAHLANVKTRAESLLKQQKEPIVRYVSRFSGASLSSKEGKPEPFADVGSGSVRVNSLSSRRGGGWGCADCANAAKYAVPRRVSWKNDRGEMTDDGKYVKSDVAFELVGVCGLHGRDAMIGIAIAELEAAGTVPSGHRYGARKRGYGSGILSMDATRVGDDKIGSAFAAWQKAIA
jgi:hypothetical protein